MQALRIGMQLAVLLGVVFVSPRVEAQPEWIIGQPSDQIRLTDLTFGSLFDGGYGFGLSPGVQIGIPVLDGGFIPAINDSFYLEPGLLVSIRLRRDTSDYVWAVPEVGPRWNFHLTTTWDVFAAVKLGWAIGSQGDFWFRASAGTQWWFTPSWALRGEFGYGAVIGPNGFLGLSYRFL